MPLPIIAAALLACTVTDGDTIRCGAERVGTDRYGRTLALAWAGRVNLSCAQIRAGQGV